MKLRNLEIVVYNELDAKYIADKENDEDKIFKKLAEKYINANKKNNDIIKEKSEIIKLAQGKIYIITLLSIFFVVLYALYLITFKVKFL